jgi:hypothetical protein
MDYMETIILAVFIIWGQKAKVENGQGKICRKSVVISIKQNHPEFSASDFIFEMLKVLC